MVTVFAELMCTLKVTFSMKIGLAEMGEDGPEDATCDGGRRTGFWRF